jgi:hypothetical protein
LRAILDFALSCVDRPGIARGPGIEAKEARCRYGKFFAHPAVYFFDRHIVGLDAKA